MFFEPSPPVEEPPDPWLLEQPPWAGPPPWEVGSVVPVNTVVARSDNVAVVVPAIRVFSVGCVFWVEVVCRQGSMSEDDWLDLHLALFPRPAHRSRVSRGGRLPDKLLRFGVRFPDGSKATTVGDVPGSYEASQEPSGPVLGWVPQSSGVRGGAGEAMAQADSGFWLWPLPPADMFEFAVEWPFAGIGLTFTEVDGSPINAAATQSKRYWPT